MEAQQPQPSREITASQIQSWPSVPTTPLKSTVDGDQASLMDVDSSAGPEDRTRRATSVLSMDDIEAAQALEGLRSDYVQSPSRQPASLPTKASSPLSSTLSPEQEPLLSLLTSTHPLVSSAINGSMSVYTSSKSYSPRFKYGAEFIERNIGSPMANTVNNVGRKTGVEGGLRWALQRRESVDGSAQQSPTKRRKVGEERKESMDIEKGLIDPMLTNAVQRRSSDMSFAESLPAYDDQRSPNYEEVSTLLQTKDGSQTSQNPTWQARLMISTSGLGVAMSEESLRSLKYCLSWLRWANGRISNVIVALRKVLKDWDESNQQSSSLPTESSANIDPQLSNSTVPRPAQDQAVISRRIQTLKSEVLQTLKQVVDVVSKYAGGALPENARNLVRRHLTSLPQRFRIASSSSAPSDSPRGPPSEMATSAHRVMVLAQEGLDMMGQVSGVVNDTLVSAESWCEKLGRKRMMTEDGSAQAGQADSKDEKVALQPEDVRMTGSDEKT